jgi:serine/threonine protein kinase
MLHDLGFLHLDIKPDNILCSTSDKAVLIDFGNTETFWLDDERKVHRQEQPVPQVIGSVTFLSLQALSHKT